MRPTKIHLCFVSFFFLFLQTTLLFASDTVHFSWALLRESDSGLTPLDTQGIISLRKNDALQFFLHPETNTYIYIFLNDSENNFLPIFPTSSTFYNLSPSGEPFMVPQGGDRFTIVPPPGQERFYLLASAKRLQDLEDLMERCLHDLQNKDLQTELSHMVKQLRRSHSKLTQVTEKGVPVSGVRRNLNSTRSAPVDPFTANQVHAKEFYSRILRLNHE